MEIDKAIGLIEAHGVFHGDHYSFNCGEFVQWCQEDTHQTLSLEQANHDLAPFCSPNRSGRGVTTSPELPHLRGDAEGGRSRAMR
ncbi:hypothetical protein [Aeromonas caviae]|uniref:hypothetical protein n=1 Tax=Aeromonas caviae TaxID=648 RepID=UPI002B495840|nr:hypothetical protein [Aeromonas caviae]